MNRHDRVRVNYTQRPFPEDTVFPAGKEGTVLETVGPYAILRIDGNKGNTTVEQQYLEVIKETPTERTPTHGDRENL
jgi:hypothetical protein